VGQEFQLLPNHEFHHAAGIKDSPVVEQEFQLLPEQEFHLLPEQEFYRR
jgi:hypothetical protein